MNASLSKSLQTACICIFSHGPGSCTWIVKTPANVICLQFHLLSFCLQGTIELQENLIPATSPGAHWLKNNCSLISLQKSGWRLMLEPPAASQTRSPLYLNTQVLHAPLMFVPFSNEKRCIKLYKWELNTWLCSAVKYDAPENITMSWLKGDLILAWTDKVKLVAHPALAEVRFRVHERPSEPWEYVRQILSTSLNQSKVDSHIYLCL